MHTYEVVQAWYLQEQSIQLEVGMQFRDGDLDPDVIAQLMSSGIVVDLDAPAPAQHPAPVIKPEPDDDKPAPRGRGR